GAGTAHRHGPAGLVRRPALARRAVHDRHGPHHLLLRLPGPGDRANGPVESVEGSSEPAAARGRGHRPGPLLARPPGAIRQPSGGGDDDPVARLNMPQFPTDGGASMRTTLFVAVVLFGGTASAADYPRPVEADVVLKDFRFATGETLDLKVHYRTIGRPRRDKKEKVLNAVLIIHGTT